MAGMRDPEFPARLIAEAPDDPWHPLVAGVRKFEGMFVAGSTGGWFLGLPI